MSDSVDRVFSHALNTVNRIRTGVTKPPAEDRLKLYGLYKQSMEGNVDGVWERPSGTGEDAQKWEAWKRQAGLSRTEAKRRYITTLIDTMHKYASTAPDARELVSELEFVWDQIKSNVSSSSSSSPPERPARHISPHYANLQSSPSPKPKPSTSASRQLGGGGLQIMNPVSDDAPVELIGDREEFVDAPDSQINDIEPAIDTLQTHDDVPEPRRDDSPSPDLERRPTLDRSETGARSSSGVSRHDQRWRKRVETALVQMTTQIAALREQLEARSASRQSRRHTLWNWLGSFFWSALKLVVVDVVLLGLILLWLRRRHNDRRLEGALRVLLGDAVATVQRGVQQAQRQGLAVGVDRLPLPRLPGKKGHG